MGGCVSLAVAAPDLCLALFREGGGGVHCGRSDRYRSLMNDWVLVVSIACYVDWFIVTASCLPVRATQSAHRFHPWHGVNVRSVKEHSKSECLKHM